MTREFSFLLDCVRSHFQPEIPLSNVPSLDWRKLVNLSERHGVGHFFWQAIRERNDVPSDIRDEVQQRTVEEACQNLSLSAELSRLLRLFAEQAIEVVSLKGPALALSLYGNEALRSSSDLDLLVRTRDVLRAKRLLEGFGYHMQSVVPSRADDACLRRRDRQISFSAHQDPDQANNSWIDLHWRLLPGYFPASFDEHQVWEDLREMSVGGIAAPTLSPEHQLMFLCAHGTKHLWQRLGWICDVAALLRVEPNLDWKLVFSQARETDTSRMVVLGLLLASELLGVVLPPEASEYTTDDKAVRALIEIVQRRLHDEILTPASALESARFSRHAFELTGHRMRFLAGIFLEPTEAEYESLKLPLALHWLYYFFRPLRLAAKYSIQNRS